MIDTYLISIGAIYCLLFIILGAFSYLSIANHLSNAIEVANTNGTKSLKHHDSVLSINFSYPSTWILKNNTGKNITLTTLDNNASISLLAVPTQTQSLEYLASSEFDNIKNQGGLIMRSSFVDLNGATAYEYKYINNIYGNFIDEIGTIIGTDSYYILYQAYDGAYIKNLPIFQKFRDSLNFTSPGNVSQKDFGFLIPKRADIKLLDSPVDIGVNPSVNKIYVASPDSNVVSVIDEKTDKIIKRIDIPNGSPNAINVDSQKNRVYIANSNSNTISVLNSLTDEFEFHDIRVGNHPIDIAIDDIHDLVFVSNQKDNTTSVIDGIFIKNIATIPVGKAPAGLSVNPITSTLYVANSKSDSVSVVDYFAEAGGIDEPSQFSSVDNDTVHISGDLPSKVFVDIKSNKVYVTNAYSHTISVINGSSRQETRTISNNSLLSIPFGISSKPDNNKIYVSNKGANTLSVINSSDDSIIDTIVTGQGPIDIANNPFDNLVYVANEDSRTISIIDTKMDKNLLAISFNVNPVNSGTISCNGKELPLNAHIRTSLNSNCEAVSNSGYSFESWTENLPGNSSKVVTKSLLSNSLWEYIVSRFTKLNDNSTISPSNTGNFVANFRANPEPIRQEYLLGIYTLAATIFTGWLIPNLTRWLNSRKQNKISLHEYNEILKSIRASNLENIDNLQDRINNQYAIGKINQSHFDLLNKSMEMRRKKTSKSNGVSTL